MTGFMAVAVAIFTSCTSEPVSVSPDEGIRLYACVDADGVPSYGVSAWGSEVLSMSSLGIDAEEADLIDYSDTTWGAVNIKHGQAYYAQQTIFLNFDIIQLTFNKEGVLTVIPVVSDPIDIINPYTPPDTVHGNGAIDWKLVAILVGVALASIVGIGLGAGKEE